MKKIENQVKNYPEKFKSGGGDRQDLRRRIEKYDRNVFNSVSDINIITNIY